MASSPFENSAKDRSAAVVPQHYVSPTTRELRAQAVHRLQIGLFGLAAMLLLVGLANIIMDRARGNDDANAAAITGSAAAGEISSRTEQEAATSDPLADIGVVPDLPAETQATPNTANSPSQPAGR